MKIAFIGCGNMAQSLVGGLIANGTDGRDIIVADPSSDATADAAIKWNVTVATDNSAAVKDAGVVILAVKPQQMKNVLTGISEQLTDQLLVSIAAGIQTRDMMTWADSPDIALVRCMPNTPALLQCGATGLFAAGNISDAQRTIAEDILNAVGLTAWVEQETQLDACLLYTSPSPRD